MGTAHYIVFTFLVGACLAQRPSYAGNRPIGYPTMDETTATSSNAELGNRLGIAGTTTTERLPIEAMGDRDLIKRLQKLPLDKQPFWFINWKALEENRNKPQTYSLRPNSYLDPVPTIHPRLGWFNWFGRK